MFDIGVPPATIIKNVNDYQIIVNVHWMMLFLVGDIQALLNQIEGSSPNKHCFHLHFVLELQARMIMETCFIVNVLLITITICYWFWEDILHGFPCCVYTSHTCLSEYRLSVLIMCWDVCLKTVTIESYSRTLN